MAGAYRRRVERAAAALLRPGGLALAATALTAASPADLANTARRAMAVTGACGLAVAMIDRGEVASVQAFGAGDDRGAPLAGMMIAPPTCSSAWREAAGACC